MPAHTHFFGSCPVHRVLCSRHSERNVNRHVLNHFLRLGKCPRDTGSQLCYSSLVWRTYWVSLLFPFLCPPRVISRYQDRVQPSKCRCLFSISSAHSTACCLVHCCLYFFVQGCWGCSCLHMRRGKRMWKLFSYQSPTLIFYFCQFQVWEKGQR